MSEMNTTAADKVESFTHENKMVFFEMIHSNGLYYTVNGFYSHNTEESRRHFVDKLVMDNDKTLETFKLNGNCLRGDEFTYTDRSQVLANLKDDFIAKGKATGDAYVSLRVFEREMAICENSKH